MCEGVVIVQQAADMSGACADTSVSEPAQKRSEPAAQHNNHA